MGNMMCEACYEYDHYDEHGNIQRVTFLCGSRACPCPRMCTSCAFKHYNENMKSESACKRKFEKKLFEIHSNTFYKVLVEIKKLKKS